MIPIVVNTDDVWLTAVPLRKAIFVSRLSLDASEHNMKSYLVLTAPSANLHRVSTFKLDPSQAKALSSFKVLAPTENMEISLNKPLRPVVIIKIQFLKRTAR